MRRRSHLRRKYGRAQGGPGKAVRRGMGGGAVIGAILGLSATGATGAAIGAAAGGLVGGEVGEWIGGRK